MTHFHPGFGGCGQDNAVKADKLVSSKAADDTYILTNFKEDSADVVNEEGSSDREVTGDAAETSERKDDELLTASDGVALPNDAEQLTLRDGATEPTDAEAVTFKCQLRKT